LADLKIDFINDPAYRRNLSQGKGEILARAIGIRKGLVDVWDATAGLARDSIMLARLGCQVRAAERHAKIFELLEKAKAEAIQDPRWQPILQRVEFIFGDSLILLSKLKEADRPQVIYLDPMFPGVEKKSALPNKQMQLFRALLQEDPDLDPLLSVAREVAKDRVVVKRPLKAPESRQRVIHSFRGTSVRYDLYSPLPTKT
jgi:16S rRNA (guanine1516-N2)-methyltransferase